MTNQDVVDQIDWELSGKLEPEILEKVLDAVWTVLDCFRDDTQEESE